MLPRNHPDRIQIAFDDPRLVANAGLLLPVTLAQHLGLREVVDSHVDLGDAPGRANPGDKLLTLVASALAGGDFIDDADVLRTGGTAGAIGCVVKAPSTLGTFLRSFRWGHVRQLDRVSRELLSRAWAAGAGPGDSPLTIDLDSTICETYGLAKEGARHHGYTGQRGYHPLLAIAAGTGEVLMSRLREGRANTVRGAAHFLRETVGRVRYGGARGQLTVRADSGFYAHALVAVCREMDVRFSITIRQHARLRELIEAIPEEDWTPVPYWMDGGADVAETTYTPFQGEPEAAPVRLIVRRVKPTPGSQLALFASYSYHGFITDRDGETLELEADHRRHAEIENAIQDLKHGVGLNHLPSGRFPANGAWLAVQVLAHNLARWTARIGLDEGVVTTRTLGALEQQITSGLGGMGTTMEGEIKALKDEHAGALRQWERRLAQVEAGYGGASAASAEKQPMTTGVTRRRYPTVAQEGCFHKGRSASCVSTFRYDGWSAPCPLTVPPCLRHSPSDS